MTKVELLKELAERTGMAQKDVKALLETFDTVVIEKLKDGEDVKTGLGTFKAIDKAERKARNPKTGEEILVPKKTVGKLAPNKLLKELGE